MAWSSFFSRRFIFDIRNYGAQIDGVTDDTDAWNDATVAANAAGGGWVVHPGGNSRVASSITMLEGVGFIGLGDPTSNATAQVTHDPAASDALFEGLGTPSATYNEFPGFKNLTLTGSKTNTTYLVDLLKPQYTLFESCRIEDAATALVRIRSGIYTFFDHCRLDVGGTSSGATGYGIHYDTLVDFRGTTLHIAHSQIREGQWSIYVEADALADLHVHECNFESMDYGIAYLSEGHDAGRAHYHFQDIRGENLNFNASTKVSPFQVGVGTGTNAAYFYADRIWISGSGVRFDRTMFQLERCMASIGNVYGNGFYDGIISTSTSTQAVHFHGPVHLRSDEHRLFGSIDDWGDVHGPLGWNIGDAGQSTTERVTQEFVATTGSVSTVDTSFALPQHVIPTRVHFHVKDAIVGPTTWDADFITGLSKKLVSGGAITHDTKVGKIITGQPRTSSTLNIRLTANAGTFTSGEVVVTLWYIDLSDRAAPVNLLQLPYAASDPALSSTGDINLDDTITDIADGMLRYYDGTTEMIAVAMPAANWASPTDTYVVTYNATNDEFELTAKDSVTVEWAEAGGILSPITGTDDVQIGSTYPFYVDVSNGQVSCNSSTNALDADRIAIGVTDATRDVAWLTSRSDQAAIVNGFGGRLLFRIGDTVADNESGAIYWIRDGADATSKLQFLCYVSGSAKEKLEISNSGLATGLVAVSDTAWGTAGIIFDAQAQTYTDTSSSGTVATAHCFTIQQPTLAASSVTTFTDAATVYIANEPAEGSQVTITNGWSLLVAAGLAKIADGLMLGRTGDPTTPPDGTIWVDTTTSNALQVQLSSSARIIPYLTGGTNNELVTAGGANFLVSESGLTYDGATLGVTGAITLTSTLTGFTNATGADTNIVTGTAGSSGYVGYWNADGDLVGSSTLYYSGSDLNLEGTEPDVIFRSAGGGTRFGGIFGNSSTVTMEFYTGASVSCASTTVTISASSEINVTAPIDLQSYASGGEPGSPQAGWLIYDSTNNKLKFYNGSTWETVTSS